ncbi:MAG: 1-acyl-sn-glycerol-3-phosphate acyltransferase [Bacilli bacterium]|nr:1-acyl-sn-glycerol-3-phosphate acyltransferase [Bacilli bacterium]
MKQKLTLEEKLAKRKLTRPPHLLYWLLGYIWKFVFTRRLHVSYKYNIRLKDFKGPYFVISNHASRVDYLYTGAAFLPHRLNYVAGYNEFFRSHLALIFHLFQVVPKRNFTTDINTIKQISRIIKKKGKIIVFPEGMSSISGSNQPCAIGTGKLIKHFGIPVLMTHISGGYLTNTKYCLDERAGKVNVEISSLFTSEDIKNMSEEEIQSKIDCVIHHDDYEWNKTARVRFDGHGEMAKNLHTLLYWCPRCHHELTMEGNGNAITCKHCGNGAYLNEYYDLIPNDGESVIPETPVKWFDLERENAYKVVSQPDFVLEEKVRLGTLLPYDTLKNLKTSELVGEGVLRLDPTGMTYTGTKYGKPFTFHMNPETLPTFGMCTDTSFITTYHNYEYYEFYPERPVAIKWLHYAEELHRIKGGKWKNFPNVPFYQEK